MATDKRLDQVSQLTDFDYALLVKGDQVGKMTKKQVAEAIGNLLYGATTKENLASVVAGLIGAFGANDSYHGNIDEIANNGAFMCDNSENVYVTSSFGLPFTIFVLCSFTPYNTKYFKFQIAINMGSSSLAAIEVKMRRFRSSWTEWESVSFV